MREARSSSGSCRSASCNSTTACSKFPVCASTAPRPSRASAFPASCSNHLPVGRLGLFKATDARLDVAETQQCLHQPRLEFNRAAQVFQGAVVLPELSQ